MELEIAASLAGTPAWKITQQAELLPGTVFMILDSSEKVRPGDEWVIRVLRLQVKCFSEIVLGTPACSLGGGKSDGTSVSD